MVCLQCDGILSGRPGKRSELKLHLNNGKTFTVLAPNVNKQNIYVQSVKVNGQVYDKTYLTHQQIMDGATVEFEMGPQPKK